MLSGIQTKNSDQETGLAGAIWWEDLVLADPPLLKIQAACLVAVNRRRMNVVANH
jgi:hypothetical protein